MKATDKNIEVDKYIKAYTRPEYKMGAARLADARDDLAELSEICDSILDVGTGRGEILELAGLEYGFDRIQGVEVVPYLCDGDLVIEAQAQELPFESGEFDLVTMFDVIEHLPPGEEILVLEELARVASVAVVVTANNRPSHFLGEDLHINIRPYEEWDEIIREVFEGWTVNWIPGKRYVSETWHIRRR